MPKSNHILKKIHFTKLKNLKNLEISFDEKPLTAILGPNGCGKSTIIHAISCINSPIDTPFSTTNHRFSEFFTPTTHSLWEGSKFEVYQYYKEDGRDYQPVSKFRKNKRWEPRYTTRIERYVSYIGIDTCVPSIEREKREGKINFQTIPLNDNLSNRVKKIAGEILNREYTIYNEHTNSNKKYIGVNYKNIDYSSLSMGAGEQRIFLILSEVLKAPNNGLILIDEIDLLLHQDALIKLLDQLNKIAKDKNLQIIFTTHAQEILSLDFIAVRHILQTDEKTLCFTSTKPDALQRLTGRSECPLEIFVEDDLAATIIQKICLQKQMKKYVAIKRFGAAQNCYTTACGALLIGIDNIDNMLFVLDGDIDTNKEDKEAKIKKILTGDTDFAYTQRENVLNKIKQFILPPNIKPEKYYHQLICKLDERILGDEQKGIQKVAKRIENTDDSHKYFNLVIQEMGLNKEVGLNKLVDMLAETPEWKIITEEIDSWLESKKSLIIENIEQTKESIELTKD
jgi:AAA ATPase